MRFFPRLAKTLALAILDRSKHRGHDLWRDLRFFGKRIESVAWKKPRPTLLDVGANEGQTAFAMAKAFPTGRIHSFEPAEATFTILRENVKHLSNVVPVRVGLGAMIEQRNLNHGEYSTTATLLEKEGARGQELVSVTTLDHYAEQVGIDRVFLLKTDTEGFDLEVMRGATSLLRNKQVDFLLVETCFYQTMDLPQTSFFECAKFLATFDYHFVHVYECIYASDGGQVLWGNSLFTCR